MRVNRVVVSVQRSDPGSSSTTLLLRHTQDLPREDKVGVLDLVAVRLKDRTAPVRISEKPLRDARERVPGFYCVLSETVVRVDQGPTEDYRDDDLVQLAPAPVLPPRRPRACRAPWGDG